MWSSLSLKPQIRRHVLRLITVLIGAVYFLTTSAAQNTPLVSGGVGFFTSSNAGNTSYLPVVSPLLAMPLGQHLLVESRAIIIESYSPKGGGQSGYNRSFFAGLTYLQLDYLAHPHATVVAGEFLTPFGTFNERLSPIWIGDFETGPLIYGLGTMGTGSSVGGMVRGSAMSTAKFSIDYSAYFSTKSTKQDFDSLRSAGGKASIYFPEQRLEIGTSYGKLLEGAQPDFIGAHLWWASASSPLRIRSEYAHGPHSQGYWIEPSYRLSSFGGQESPIGRLEPVLRMQQAFRNSPDSSDGLPSTDTVRTDFGLDYHLPHEMRINTDYSRQFSSSGNRNIWETGIIYRFLFPTWKGR